MPAKRDRASSARAADESARLAKMVGASNLARARYVLARVVTGESVHGFYGPELKIAEKLAARGQIVGGGKEWAMTPEGLVGNAALVQEARMHGTREFYFAREKDDEDRKRRRISIREGTSHGRRGFIVVHGRSSFWVAFLGGQSTASGFLGS